MEDSETSDNNGGRETDCVSFVAGMPCLDEGKSFLQEKLVGNESPSEAAAEKLHSPSRLAAHLVSCQADTASSVIPRQVKLSRIRKVAEQPKASTQGRGAPPRSLLQIPASASFSDAL